MAEKNSLWKNIRNKAKQNRKTGTKPKEPTDEMLRQERKIKAKQYAVGGPIGEDDGKNKVLKGSNDTLIAPTLNTQIVEEEAPQWMKDKENIKPDEIDFWESFNPKKWGLKDYSDYSSFNSAFRNARESGEKEFVWNKNRYNTDLIPEEINNQYLDSKKFLQDYYTNEPFIPLDTNYFDVTDFNNKVSKDKYGYTWSEYYDKVQKTPAWLKNASELSDEEAKIFDSNVDTLDLLQRPSSYSSLSDEDKSEYYKYQKSKYLDALNDPNYYFSITSQPNPEDPVLGYQNSRKKKLYVSNTGNRNDFTTFVHELSHKGDSKSRSSYGSKSTRIPTVDVDVLNKFGSRLSQDRFEYVSDPTETEARKMSTLYFMNKILKKDIRSGKIKNRDLTELYNLYNLEGGYWTSKSIPNDVRDLLELYKYQWDDLLKYLNNDFSYRPIKKAEGGPVNTLEGDLLSKVIMNRNRDKDFVQRAYAVGEYPESNMFVQPDANEFGQKNSHLMSWGEDENGQAYMYPKVMNPNNEDIKVPNQYADYISSIGYKKATGIPYATGGPIGEGDDGKPVTLYKKAQYDASTDRVLEYAGTEDNKYYVTPNTPQGIDFQSSLPEFEVIEDTGMYNPDVSGYTAPQYIPSETGLIPNSNYRPLASGALEPVYPEAALLPGNLPIKATSTLGKIGVFGLETAIDNPGFGLGSTIKNTLNKQKNELFKLAKGIKLTADEFIVTPIQFRKEIAELRKLKKDYSSILNTEEGKRRLALLGIDPSKISDYDLTFKPNVGSAFGTGFDDFINKMNIDFRQVQKLKKKGHMVSPKSIFEHEFGHLLQKESYKQQGILKDLDIYNKDLIEHNKIKDRILNNPYLTSIHKSLRLQIHKASEPVKPFITPKPTLTDVGAKQLTINNSIIDNKKIAEKIAAKDKLSFPEKSYSYFNHSTDVERFAHLREMRQNMIESGVIKNMYDPITSEDLAKFIANSPGDRVSSFIDTSPNNIEWLKTLLNNMPAAVPAVGVGVGIGVGALQQDSEPQQQAYGGPINPYMYYAGGPMEYGNGGKVFKHIGAGAYSLGEGILDTVTMGATDQLTDKGFEGLTKLGNKNMDLSDPANAKFLRTQQQIKGYGNTTAAVATGIFTGNVQGAVTQGAKGLNTAFQATEGLSDDFKKWSNISNTAIGIGAGLAGGSLNTEGASASASEAAGKIGEIGGKISPYANQAVGMLGGNSQPMWQQAQAQQDLLNSPEYAAQQALSNQQYVNQGLSFSHGGNIANNSLNLQSMKGRYNNYKNRYAKGGTFNQYGIDMIPDSAGLHHENAYGGVPIGPNALGEGGEIKMDTPDGGQYMVSDQVDGTESQKDFTFSKGGKYKELNRTLAEGMKQDLNRYSFGSLATNSNSKDSLRRPNDSYAQSTIDQIKQKWQQKTEFARQRSQQEQAITQAQQQKQLIEEEYIAAYGGRINPKKYPGLNMPKKSKGGYVYNAMTEPMLAMGGPLYGNTDSQYTYAMGGPTDPPSNKLISNDKVLGYIADMNERGMLEPGKTFQPSWYSDLEKRQIDLNKELSPVDLGRVKSLYNYKQNNRNIFGFAQGGPMVSNVQQPFNGPAAQNRGGMMMANGGMMQQQGGQDQMMQLIQAYAQATGISPEEIIQQLQQMDPQSQEQAIQQMAQELQGSEQQSMQQQMSPQQGMMARGGRMYDGGGPYDLPGMADMSQSEYNSVNTYLNNLNTPNVVDNQGNTSSILDRMRKNNSQTTPNTMSPIESIKPINFLQNSQMPGIVGNQQEMPTFYSKPSNFNAEDIEIPSINPLDRSLKSLTEMPTLTGNAESMPALSNAATFISPYQKYLAENKPKVLDNLTFLEAEDEDEINFEYGTISNPYRKKSPASNSTTPWYDEPTYSKIARYLPLAASAAGIATGLKNKKRSLTPERISPEQINLERSRITSMEEGRRALDSGLRNVRGNSSNTGQLAANTRDMILNYNKNMGANIAKSYETEENTNAQLRQQSSLANQQYGNQFKQLNEEMFQNAQTIALRAAQEGAMLAQSGAEQERKQYLQEWIAKNRLNTRSYKTNIDGKDVYVSPDGKIYDEQGNPVT